MRETDNGPRFTRREALKGGLSAAAVFVLGKPREIVKTDYSLPPEEFSGQEILDGYCNAYSSSARVNIIEYPAEGKKIIVPSSAYRNGVYCRDSFFSVIGLGDQSLSSSCYREFEKGQDWLSGQIPPMVLLNKEDKSRVWRDDESSLIFLIWSGIVNKRGEQVNREVIEKAFGFVQKHVEGCQYHSEPGDFTYWADTLLNPKRQVITYNQGLYVCAMRTMYENNWGGVTLDQVEKAREGYEVIWKQNWENGYLPQAQGGSYIDFSSLFPEVLSRYLFDESILPNWVVLRTIDHYLTKAKVANIFTGKLHGLKIICQGNGDFLPKRAISVKDFAEPGDYQNGAYWPMWTLVDLALAFKIAPESRREEYRQTILKLLEVELDRDQEAKEYIRLCPDPGVLGSSEEMRHKYSWNVFFVPIARWAGLTR